MNIAATLQDYHMSVDALMLVGLLALNVLAAASLSATLITARRLRRRVDAQAAELADLRAEALDRVPAKAAVAAALLVNGDRSANMAALEQQLDDLMAEWQQVEDLSEEAYAILRNLRQRGPAEAVTE